MKFKFFSKTDSSKEKIGIIEADDIESAELLASKIKKLKLKDFTKLFTLEKLETHE